MKYHKIGPVVSYDVFLEKVKRVSAFTSSLGKRYRVQSIVGDVLNFKRVDAGGTEWDINLKNLYQAYKNLDDFETKNFLPFVPRRHSPGRGLLINLELIAQKSGGTF